STQRRWTEPFAAVRSARRWTSWSRWSTAIATGGASTTSPCSGSNTRPSRRLPSSMAAAPPALATSPHYEESSMEFALAPEQEEFRKVVHEFAQTVVAPRAEAMDRAEQLDPDILDQMAGMGLFGLPFGEEYGGMGADFLTLCLAIEELARVDSSVAITLEAAVGLGGVPLWRYGTEEQKRRWLPPLAAGEGLAAFGLTEPGGGSDAGAVRTRAVQDGDQWVIDGTKAFITNAGLPRSMIATVAAATGTRPDGRPEVTTIIVPVGTPGFTVGRSYSKVGWHASATPALRTQKHTAAH